MSAEQAGKNLDALRAQQDAWRNRVHENNMQKSPWIRETVNAWRSLTPEQQAELLEKAGNKRWSR